VCFSFSFFSSFSTLFLAVTLGRLTVPTETSIGCNRIVLFLGSYDVIFISFVVLGYIIEMGFLINLFLLFLLVYPGFSVILVDCCGVAASSR
jgi:hypothetical protein